MSLFYFNAFVLIFFVIYIEKEIHVIMTLAIAARIIIW